MKKTLDIKKLILLNMPYIQQEARQLNLFDRSDYEKQERLDAAIDRIRERYGVDSVKRAVFVESPIDHMCGRATREKRKVDYSKIHIE